MDANLGQFRLATCSECGWVHFVLSKDEVEEEVDRFNSFYQGLSANDQESYDGPSCVENYQRCFNCENSYKNFQEAKRDDCPAGVTIQPIMARD